jgi:hypothetical protein
MYHRLKNQFGCIQWYSSVTTLWWKPVSVHLEIVLILTQDRCMVCAKHTIGSKSVCTHPMVLLGVEALVEACFSPFRDSANLDA